MGYRSEVTLAMTWDTDNRLRDINVGIKQFLDGADTKITMGNPNFISVYQWDWIKWYGHTVIEEIENFLHHNVDEKEYMLVNIGENLDDMTIEGTLSNNRIKVIRNVLIW